MENGHPHSQSLPNREKEHSAYAVSARQTHSSFLWGIGKDVGEGIHFVLVALIVFVIAYVIGREIFVGEVGNDSLLHIANAEWFDQFLPDIPNWFPLHGGGISLQRSYSVLPYILVSVVRRIAEISILQAYRLVSFISVPATALGIYLFCRMVLSNRTIGLIAAILFLLSPISWSWILVQGYLATTVAIVTLPLTLLCFDRYVTCLITGQGGVKRRWWLFGLVVTFSITVLLHVVVAGAAIVGMALYAIFFAIVSRKERRLGIAVTGVKSILICGLISSLILAFWAVPLLTYARATNPNGVNRLADSSVQRPELTELFSIKPLDAQEWNWYRDSSIPVVVGVLFMVGAAAAAFSSRKILAIALTGAAAIGYTLVPDIAITLNKAFPMWSAVIGVRSFTILASIMFPIVAAYGAWVGPMALITAIGSFLSRIRFPNPLPRDLTAFGKGAFASIIALIVAGGALYIFRNVSIQLADRVNYGVDREGIDIRDIWATGDVDGSLIDQLFPINWPLFEIADWDPHIEEIAQAAAAMPTKEFLRMDVSPYLGMYSQRLSADSGASQINTYIWPANLMWSIWGYQQKVMFIDSPPEAEDGTPTTLNDVADWFGTEFVYLNPAEDKVDIYPAAGWEPIAQESLFELWQYPSAPGLATLSTRPKFLVISSESHGAYELVFRAANRGAIPYSEAFIIKGRENVDSYSIEELQKFDVLFLEGYSYRNSNRAWALLEEYVEQGGSLFVDTGWQWGVPEWEFEIAPAVLPVASLKWTDFGTTTEYRLESEEIAGSLNPSNFGPLIWNGGPWAVSAASRESVKPWGDIVLSANDHPLIVAGRYGEGRVVWSGMNLVVHLNEMRNDAETEMLHNLVQWLIAGKSGRDIPVEISRSHPDRIEFVMNVPPGEEVALLWRESYYPAWHAYFRAENMAEREVPIQIGGPGFMLMPIDNAHGPSVVELVWKTPLIERLAGAVSVLTLIIFGIFIFDGVATGGRLFSRIGLRFKPRKKKELPRGSIAWLPDLVDEDSESGL